MARLCRFDWIVNNWTLSFSLSHFSGKLSGIPHKNKPDKDNLEMALYDALFDDDAHIWCGWVEKRWALTGAIEIIALVKLPC